jgi:diguanylate cyclase (GGDEF)-like protein
MMLDIDHFKNVNDLYGHASGDNVLRELGQRFRTVMREADLISRYGGEEFCFLLPESDCQVMCTASDRLLHEVRSQPFLSDGIEIYITVSIGVTTMVDRTSSLEDLIQEADQALYFAKQTGRDRAELFDSHVVPGSKASKGPA